MAMCLLCRRNMLIEFLAAFRYPICIVSNADRADAESALARHGIVVDAIVTSEEFHRGGVELVKRRLKKFAKRPTYITLDIDVVDPAFAPGTGTPQVGGLSSAQILDLVRGLKRMNLVGCDLVEVSPPYDNGEITSLLAANLLYELICLF